MPLSPFAAAQSEVERPRPLLYRTHHPERPSGTSASGMTPTARFTQSCRQRLRLPRQIDMRARVVWLEHWNMKAAIASIALPVALLGAWPAHAASPPTGLTDWFVRFCGSTRGDADSALQAADADGWSIPPKGTTMPPFGPGEWLRRQGRLSQMGGVRRVLMVGTVRVGGKDTLMCTVSEGMPPGTAAVAGVQQALQKWVGGDPLRANGDFAEFAYRESHGLRLAVPRSEDPLANDAPRPPPDVAAVTIIDVMGVLTITYMRSYEGRVGAPFGGAPSS
jgi:hypothetical protein